jgi:hypothetical protein
MQVVSVDSIEYRILCDGTAIIQPWNNSVTIARPRNCVAVNGTRVSVTNLEFAASATVVRTILIPHSLHVISGFHGSRLENLKYLIFESGNELQSITDSNFHFSRHRLLFFPPSVHRPVFLYPMWLTFILDIDLPSGN